MALLLASKDGLAAARQTKGAPTANVRKLMSFTSIDASKHNHLRQTELNQEERGGSLPVEGGGAAAQMNASNDQDSKEEVTVTKYSNNGVLQKFQRWWKRTFGEESQSSPSLAESESKSTTN